MSKVISLHGDPLPPGNGTVNDTLVGTLEDMLADARSGKLVSLAFVAVDGDGDISAGWSHPPGRADRLSTGIMVLTRDFTDGWTA